MSKSLIYLLCALLMMLVVSCTEIPFSRKPDGLTIEQRLQQSQQYFVEHPLDKKAKVQWVNDQYRRVNQLLGQADFAYQAGDIEQTRAKLKNILLIDANNPRAIESLNQLDRNDRHGDKINEARNMMHANPNGARLILRQVLLENPSNIQARNLIRTMDEKASKDLITPRKLKPTGTVSLDFHDANLREIFEVFSKSSGINIVLDPNVRPDLKASIFVKDASVEDVIDFLLLIHQLNKKVLTDNSLLIYPANKAGQYDDLILRTFYLNHADVKQTVSLIKTMHPIKDIFIDEKLNMFSVKATYEQLASIEKLIVDEDLADPEVLLDVEILEVNRTHLTDIGIAFPDTFSVLGLNAGTGTDGTGTTVSAGTTLHDLHHINGGRIGISPDLALRLLRQDGENNLLANPRIRVKSREKAKILIGDKIPILTTTVASNSNFASRSANYLDVGLKLDVEPRVMLNNEVSIRISLEVSNATFTTSSEFPTIGTRNASTVLMTGDGETQVLAGLINDEDRQTIRKVPGLSGLPFIGRLFTEPRDVRSKTEIVLLITPHVVRNFQRPEATNTEFYSGAGALTTPLDINPAAIIQQPISESPATQVVLPPPTNSSNSELEHSGNFVVPSPKVPDKLVVPSNSIGPSEKLQQLGSPPVDAE